MPTKIIDLIGFAPDADPTLSGALLEVKHFVPTQRGFMAQPRWTGQKNKTGAPTGYPKLVFSEKAETSLHEYMVVTSTGGTASYVYGRDVASSDWTDVGVTAGFTASPSYGFSQILRFGDYQVLWMYGASGLYARGQALTQGFATGNRFASISGAPSSVNALVSANRFVMALGGTHDGATAAQDGWYCSARDDHTSWTVSTTTLCARGRLVSTQGALTAGIEFADEVIAFKRDSMYRGRFAVGSDEVWQWEKLPYAVGCAGANAVCKVDDMVAFVHSTGVYVFDGAQIVNLTDGFANWLSQYTTAMVTDGDLGYYDLYRQLFTSVSAHLRYDSIRKLLFLTLPSTSIRATYGLACHVPTRRWAKIRYGGFAIEPGWMYASPQTSRLTPTMICAENEGTAFGSTASIRYMIYGDTNGATTHYDATLSPLNARTAGGDMETKPTFTLNDFGDDFAELELTEARIRFIVAPSASMCVPSYRNTLDATATTLSPVAASSDGKFDLRQSARWHRLTFTLSDDTARAELLGLRLAFTPHAER